MGFVVQKVFTFKEIIIIMIKKNNVMHRTVNVVVKDRVTRLVEIFFSLHDTVGK